jgi:DNA (cytosine-5)-methyltransferase 1
MPRREVDGMSALSLFSGGGGLDLGFERAGFAHVGSWEWLAPAGETLRMNRPHWDVHSGPDGDVRNVDWRPYRGTVTVLHGGPPCQPFSNAGKQRGAADPRDMWPEFVRAVREIGPDAFVAENVAALGTTRFSQYVDETILTPLASRYHIARFVIQAHEVGVPQARRRLIFVGFRRRRDFDRWAQPLPKFRRPGQPGDLPVGPGVRWALGLPDGGYDDISPTIRSGLSGPRHTTSVLSSVSAQRRFEALGIWPNGVAATREAARAFVARNGDFRMAVPDVGLIQGFPESWRFAGATYMQLGQIGNAVAPPVGYEIASSVGDALRK